MRSLTVGTLDDGMRALLSGYLAGPTDMLSCVMFTCAKLALCFLSTNSRVVSEPLAVVALAIRLGCLICSAPCLSGSDK